MAESTIPALLGRYRPQQVIGRGGEASIFRAVDELLGREVAIKLYRSGGEEEMEQYRTEQAALARLSHHGIVSLIDAGIDYTSPKDPRPFLIMELVQGTDLATELSERELRTEEIAEIAYDVGEALEYVHAHGVVHRDIKPSNIMLVTYGTTTFRARARLTDFGIASGVIRSHANTWRRARRRARRPTSAPSRRRSSRRRRRVTSTRSGWCCWNRSRARSAFREMRSSRPWRGWSSSLRSPTASLTSGPASSAR